MLLRNDNLETESKEITSTKYIYYVKKIVIFVMCVLACCILSALGICIKNRIELNYITKQTTHFLEEIKLGYIEENDYDMPIEIYNSLTKDWNKVLKSVLEYGLGGSEEWRRGWDSVLESFEYTVDSVEKEDGVYHINITVKNKDLIVILTETAAGLLDDKSSLTASLITGTTPSMFWDIYESSRDATNTMVEGSYQVKMYKKDKDWVIEYDTKMIGTMAGVEEKYLESISSEKKTLRILAD